MGIDLEKLRSLQKRIEQKAHEEMMQNMSERLINFVLDEDLLSSYKKEKGREITTQSKRVIGHWVKEGVISGEQNTEGGWYYFNKTELIWIDIVTQLREFGLSLKKIKLIRSKLFEEKVPNFRIIDFALMHTILRDEYVMLVYSNGEINLTTLTLYEEAITLGALTNHILFSFKKLVYDTFPSADLEILGNDFGKNLELTQQEMKLLYYLRTKEYKEIRIKATEGEIYLIEGEKEHSINSKITDLIRKASYQDITIKVADDKIVFIKSIEKSK